MGLKKSVYIIIYAASNTCVESRAPDHRRYECDLLMTEMKFNVQNAQAHFKPIFHCEAKPFTLGTFGSPNTKDTNMLVSFALGDAIFLHHPMQSSNASQWNIG